MFCDASAIFSTEDSSASGEVELFLVAITTPLVALMPSAVRPLPTAVRAWSIWVSLPVGENVVSESKGKIDAHLKL